MRISDWSSDVCSSDLQRALELAAGELLHRRRREMADADLGERPLDRRRLVAPGQRHQPPHRERQGPVDGKALRHVADGEAGAARDRALRSEEHTSELQSLMRISYAVFCLKKKNIHKTNALKKNRL